MHQYIHGFPSPAISFISASEGSLTSLTGYLKIEFKNIWKNFGTTPPQ